MCDSHDKQCVPCATPAGYLEGVMVLTERLRSHADVAGQTEFSGWYVWVAANIALRAAHDGMLEGASDAVWAVFRA